MSSSVPSSTVVYFITGANRGIGYGLTERLAARPHSLVFATARDPSKADQLQQLAKQHSNIRVVKLSVDSEDDHAAAAKRVEAEAGRVDVVLANAGISEAAAYERSGTISIDKLRAHWEVNTVGPVRLFNHFLPLLSRSSTPKFVVVSSSVGSNAYQVNLPTFLVTNYGSSKAAINFITQRIHIEHPNIVAFPLNPGWVQTEMGNAGAGVAGIGKAPMTLDESVTGIVKAVDESTRDTHGGRLWDAPTSTTVGW